MQQLDLARKHPVRTSSGVPTPRIPPSEPRNIFSDDVVETDLVRLNWAYCFEGMSLICVPKKRLGDAILTDDENAWDGDSRNRRAAGILMVSFQNHFHINVVFLISVPVPVSWTSMDFQLLYVSEVQLSGWLQDIIDFRNVLYSTT